MLIGELARQAGLTKDTVRFYLRAGLISAGEKEAGSRTYQTFDGEALERLLFIKGGQSSGFTLREIKSILDTWGTNLDAIPTDELIASIEAKIRQTDEKIERLTEIRSYLERKLETAKSGRRFSEMPSPCQAVVSEGE